MSKDIYSAGEVAALTGLSTKAVLKAIRHGQLAAYKFGPRTIRIPAKSVEAWQVQARARAMALTG